MATASAPPARPGRAQQTARGPSPAAMRLMNAAPPLYAVHGPGSAPASGSSSSSGASPARWAFSARACRCGTARARTSDTEAAQDSATRRARPYTSPVSTGRADTTRRRGRSLPPVEEAESRATTKPEALRPATSTETRTPGTAAASIAAGTR